MKTGASLVNRITYPTVIIALCAVSIIASLTNMVLRGTSIDEYATLWFSDPNLSLPDLYHDRWLNETNPPLFYAVVTAIRRSGLNSIEYLRFMNAIGLILFSVHIFAARKHQPSASWMLLIYIAILSSNTVFSQIDMLRSYFFQYMMMSSLVLSLYVLYVNIDAEASWRKLNLYIALFAIFVLVNLHFFSLVLTSCMVGMIAITYFRDARHRSVFWLAGSLIFGLFVFGIYVYGSHQHLKSESQQFWIPYWPIGVWLKFPGIIVQGVGYNIAALIVAGFGIYASVRRARDRDGGETQCESISDRERRFVRTLFLSTAAFVAVLFVVNCFVPVVGPGHYFTSLVPVIGLIISIMANNVLTRYKYARGIFIANLLIAYALTVTAVADSNLQWNEDGQIIGAEVAQCPQTKVYPFAIEWNGEVLSTQRDKYFYDIGYDYISAKFHFPVAPVNDPAAASDFEHNSCGAILWFGHAAMLGDGKSDAPIIAILKANQLWPATFDASTDAVHHYYLTKSGIIIVYRHREE